MPSIKDIAALAGVSKATVSRVINGTGYVSDSTRRRVEEVIRETGFMPSASAVGLSRGRTQAVGVVVPEIDNSFYGEVLRGVITEADRAGIQLFLYDTQNSAEKEARTLAYIAQQQLMGILIAPSVDYACTPEGPALVESIRRLEIPVVLVDRDFDGNPWDGVFFENHQGAYNGTVELIRAGARRLGVITGGDQLMIARERFHGFEQALRDNGLKYRKKDILSGDFSLETAFRLSQKLLRSGDWPDAVLACNNRSSIGFLKACAQCGVEVGKDIALMGIDSLPVLGEIGLPFSCVARDNQQMGRLAMQLMLERLRGERHTRKTAIAPYHIERNGWEKRMDRK